MNRCILVGNLTKDPEISTTSGGISVGKFTLAVSRRFSDADGNRETDFLSIVVWRQQAENCGKYLKKGSKASVCGSVQTRSYDDKDGNKRYVTEIIADEVEFLNTKRDDEDKESTSKKNDISELTPIDDDDLPF